MTSALIIGSSFGAAIGLFHAWRIYVQRTQSPAKLTQRSVAVRAGALYSALWAFVLWTLFGSYVLYLWGIAVVVYAIYLASKQITKRIPARA